MIELFRRFSSRKHFVTARVIVRDYMGLSQEMHRDMRDAGMKKASGRKAFRKHMLEFGFHACVQGGKLSESTCMSQVAA